MMLTVMIVMLVMIVMIVMIVPRCRCCICTEKKTLLFLMVAAMIPFLPTESNALVSHQP